MVIGRFYWQEGYPCPWVEFRNITAYKEWARSIRKYYPKDKDGNRTKFEYEYVNRIWTAAGVLHAFESGYFESTKDD